MNRQYLFCKLFRFLEDIREKRMSLPTLTDRKLFYFWKLKTNYNSKKCILLLSAKFRVRMQISNFVIEYL